MKHLFVALLLAITALSANARNVNPRHKLTVVIENYVLQTEIGQSLLSELHHRVPRFDYLVGCPETMLRNGICPNKRAYRTTKNELIIHPNFGEASYEYHSWIVVLAMAKMVFEKRYQLDLYPRLRVLEIEQMVFLTAQKYWQQRNAPMSFDLDYYHSGRSNGIARQLDLSTRAFTQSYNEDNLLFFFNKVAVRAKRFDGIKRSADDIITGSYSKKEREIARDIKADLHSDLTRITEF